MTLEVGGGKKLAGTCVTHFTALISLPCPSEAKGPLLFPPVCVISSVRAGASSASFRCPKPSMRLSRCGTCTRPTWGPDGIEFPAPTPDLLTQTLQGGAQGSACIQHPRWFWGSLPCWFLYGTTAHPTEEVRQALMGTTGREPTHQVWTEGFPGTADSQG